MLSIETTEDANNYLNDWKDMLDGIIASKDPEHSIESYPEVQQAFDTMRTAWVICFRDSSNMDKILERDKAILKLGKKMKEAIG